MQLTGGLLPTSPMTSIYPPEQNLQGFSDSDIDREAEQNNIF
jgi:hypothetical protein